MSIETTKTKTKMKSGTIAIIALSIVLVLSLVTTITLAYFTATRNVVTTIKFSEGVWLQMGGVYVTSSGAQDTPASRDNATGPVNLYWQAEYVDTSNNHNATRNTSGSTAEEQSTYLNVDDTIEFEEVLVRVLKTNAYVAMKVAIYGYDTDGSTSLALNTTNFNGYQQPVMAANWTAMNNTMGSTTALQTTAGTLGSGGWFVYTSSSAPVAMVAPATYNDNDNRYTDNTNTTTANSYVKAISAWQVPANNSTAGKKLVCNIYVFASTTVDGLIESINTSQVADATNVGYATAYVAP